MKNEKTQVTSLGLNQNFSFTGGKNKGLNSLNYRKYERNGQCSQCGSDYMKHSVNGFCQDCMQRVEFIVREHPQTLRNINMSQQNSGGLR